MAPVGEGHPRGQRCRPGRAPRRHRGQLPGRQAEVGTPRSRRRSRDSCASSGRNHIGGSPQVRGPPSLIGQRWGCRAPVAWKDRVGADPSPCPPTCTSYGAHVHSAYRYDPSTRQLGRAAEAHAAQRCAGGRQCSRRGVLRRGGVALRGGRHLDRRGAGERDRDREHGAVHGVPAQDESGPQAGAHQPPDGAGDACDGAGRDPRPAGPPGPAAGTEAPRATLVAGRRLRRRGLRRRHGHRDRDRAHRAEAGVGAGGQLPLIGDDHR